MFGYHVSDLQNDDVTVENGAITGTIKYLTEGQLVDRWGAGNFIALKFSDLDPRATSVKCGMDPSAGSGLVEIIDDPDKDGAWKITNKDEQVFVVESTNGTLTTRQTFTLSGLTLMPEAEG